ncbi:MAG: hypothetical protein F6K19_13600 [Cyanothece sp. SIO1E1]|nr:hypothetical protein [Cyanothece sp. SIO1E1]
MNRNQRLRATSMVAAAILISGLLISKSLSVDVGQAQQYRSAIIDLQREESALGQYVLQSKHELYAFYDPLVENLAAQAAIQQHLLAEIPSFIDAKGQQEIKRILTERANLLEQKQDLSEWFKSQNSLLKNSLRYLPFLASQIEGNSDNQTRVVAAFAPPSLEAPPPSGTQVWLTPLKLALNDLLRNILLYNISTDQSLTPTIKQQINQLSQLRDQYKINENDFPITLIISHANLVLTQKPQVEALTTQLLSPLQQQTGDLEQAYDQYYQQAVTVTNQYRLYTYGWLLFLLALVSYMGYQQRRPINPEVAVYKQQLGQLANTLATPANDLEQPANSFDLANRDAEINTLARSVQTLAEKRQQREDTLQQQIDQLTAELGTYKQVQQMVAHEESFNFLTARLGLLTKGGKKLLLPPIMQQLKPLLSEVLSTWGCQLISFEGEPNHIQLRFSYPPQVKLSELVAHLKMVAATLIGQELPTDVNASSGEVEIWSKAYFITSCEENSLGNGVNLQQNMLTSDLPDTRFANLETSVG